MKKPTSHPPNAKRPRVQSRGPAAQLLYLGIGYAALAAGIIGVFLPLMPTTVFLLVAAWSFARSNPALADWIEAHPRFGPALAAWRREGAISASSKVTACFAIALSFALCAVTITDACVLAALAVILGCIALFITTRPAPRPRDASVPEPEKRWS